MKRTQSKEIGQLSTRISSPVVHVIIGAFIFSAVHIATPLHAVDFVRGDANGDGEVTFADVHTLIHHLFHGLSLECDDAGDWDDDGNLGLTDAVEIFQSLVLDEGHPPYAPYPEPGPDPTDDSLGCAAYGSGSVLVDERSLMELASSPAGGGDAGAELFLEVASSAPLAGFHVRIRDEGGILDHVNLPWRRERYIADDYFILSSELNQGVWEVSYLMKFQGDEPDFIPAFSDHTKILQFEVCLKEGITPGDYPLSFEFAELIDYETGRAIHPANFVSEGLRVRDEVLETESCERRGEEPDEPPDGPQPPDPCPPGEPRETETAVDLVDVDITYKLDSATATPGETASLTFAVNSSLAVQGLSFSLNFDERNLEVLSVEQIHSRPDGGDFAFEVFRFNNDNEIPGNGIDEGNVLGASVFNFYCDVFDIPPGDDVPYVRLNFLVKPGAEHGETEVRFEDGARGKGEAVNNAVTVANQTVIPDFASSFVFVDGLLKIVPGVTTFNKFTRGDANDDGAVDISDPVTTLGVLFLGEGTFLCQDAADSNDDGQIDISDPIGTLGALFLKTGTIPFPGTRDCGDDPTEDAMDCKVFESCAGF